MFHISNPELISLLVFGGADLEHENHEGNSAEIMFEAEGMEEMVGAIRAWRSVDVDRL